MKTARMSRGSESLENLLSSLPCQISPDRGNNPVRALFLFIGVLMRDRKEHDALYRQRHKEQTKRAVLKWREENPDKYKEYQAEYRLKNKEKERARKTEWARNNPDKVAAKHARRRTRKTKAGGFFTANEWFLLCFAVGFRCLCCGERKLLTPDHVVPVVLGGTSWLYNIQPLCLSCNDKKGIKIIDYREQEQQCRPLQST